MPIRLSAIRRFSVLTFALGLAVTTAFSLITYRAAFDRETQSAEQTTEFAADQATLLFEILDIAIRHVGRAIKTHHGAPDFAERCEDALADTRASVPRLRTLIIIDPSGVVIGDLRPDRPGIGLNVSDREYFQSAVASANEDLMIREPVVSRVDGVLTYPLSRAVRDESGGLLAVVTTSVERGFFDAIWRDAPHRGVQDLTVIHPESNVAVTLSDAPGTPEEHSKILARWAPIFVANGSRPTEPIRSMQNGRLEIAAPLLDGREFAVVGQRDTSEIRRIAGWQTAGVGGVGVAGSVLLALALHRFLRRSARLGESERLVARMAANVPGALFLYRLNEDGTDSVEYVNEGCVDLWEYDAREIQGNPTKLWECIHPDDLEGMQASVAASAEQLTSWAHQWRITTPSGREKWLSGRGQPERLEGGKTQWVTIVLDITEQVRMEDELSQRREQMHQSQKLEALGQLTGGIAHDFNNILALILASLELLKHTETGGEARDVIDTSIHAVNRGADLTKSMLAFARQAKLEPKAVDLNATVGQVAKWAARVLPSTIEFSTQLSEDLQTVMVDPASTESALLNLILNARDAMPNGGELSVATETLELRSDDPELNLSAGNYAVIVVRDTGTGITEEQISTIFEPFYTTKGPSAGSGLGLSMVLGFMEQSGGTVSVDSEPEKGTTFKLFFPTSSVARPTGDGGVFADPNPEFEPGRILVVEDSEEYLSLLERLLKSAGHSVITAKSGDEAIRAIRNGLEFDLLITDVVMPGTLQGLELATAVRTHSPERPVIFVTGYAGSSESQLQDEIHFMKPVPERTLLEAVAAQLERSSTR